MSVDHHSDAVGVIVRALQRHRLCDGKAVPCRSKFGCDCFVDMEAILRDLATNNLRVVKFTERGAMPFIIDEEQS